MPAIVQQHQFFYVSVLLISVNVFKLDYKWQIIKYVIVEI